MRAGGPWYRCDTRLPALSEPAGGSDIVSRTQSPGVSRSPTSSWSSVSPRIASAASEPHNNQCIKAPSATTLKCCPAMHRHVSQLSQAPSPLGADTHVKRQRGHSRKSLSKACITIRGRMPAIALTGCPARWMTSCLVHVHAHGAPAATLPIMVAPPTGSSPTKLMNPGLKAKRLQPRDSLLPSP